MIPKSNFQHMAKSLRKLDTHRKAKNIINRLYDDDSYALIIHYSCEDFYKIKDGKTPRITSIAIQYLKSGQIKSFSIHKVAELMLIPFVEITNNYDLLEKQMLTDFLCFLESHKDYQWIHWNMRDINYGFEAISHRAEILKIKKFDLLDSNKYDLARLLIDKYGDRYSDNPRLPNLLKMNRLEPKNWLNGEEEALAFDNQEYVKLHQSTLTKVNAFSKILKLAAQDKLKTKSKMKDIYGITPQGIFERIKDNWLYSLILAIISFISGLIFR